MSRTSAAHSHHDLQWDDESFHRYTGGRWVYNEDKQLADRHVEFNMTELVRAAAETQGCNLTSSIKVEKLPEGNFNKTFLITVDGGQQVVAKIPNPNAGFPFYTTASEVATMDFARSVAGMPVPEVYAWNPNTTDNPVGAEYIIMEKAKGVPLSAKWPSMSKTEKIQLMQSIVSLEKSLLSHRIDHIGSIYYKSDLAGLRRKPRYSDTGYNDFVVGPATERMFLQDGRRHITTEKGPWKSAYEYILASSRRERDCIQQSSTFPRPEGIFGGPGGYKPTANAKLAVLNDFDKVAFHLLPKDISTHTPVLWHNDLHHDNIFINPANPAEILSIIDWQAAHTSPLFKQAHTPAFLDFEGPKPALGLSTLPPLPENFETLSPEEKEEAQELQSQQSLYKLYEVQSARTNMPVYKALQHAETLGAQIISLVSQVFNDGEPIIRGQLIQVIREWEKIVGPNGPPCPLTVTSADIAEQAVDQRRWEEGVQMMEDVLEALGGAENGWEGWVGHDDYEGLKRKVGIVKEQFLDEVARDEMERGEWERVWPFRDD
ncbi:hypothetical protein FQN51_006205 [Onygenales sp. PD_10]|nr:hypothetical protein FQN51_006205 [Onygenales sp. PD_10]